MKDYQQHIDLANLVMQLKATQGAIEKVITKSNANQETVMKSMTVFMEIVDRCGVNHSSDLVNLMMVMIYTCSDSIIESYELLIKQDEEQN